MHVFKWVRGIRTDMYGQLRCFSMWEVDKWEFLSKQPEYKVKSTYNKGVCDVWLCCNLSNLSAEGYNLLHHNCI